MMLLLVDDDLLFCRLMARQLQAYGQPVVCAHDQAGALALLAAGGVDKVVLDLKLGEQSGLALLARIRAEAAELPVVLLTGYAAVATAVDAIKLGAVHYLAKPVTAATLLAAFDHQPQAGSHSAGELAPPSVARLTWEHIQQTLAAHSGNISASARALGMHRRTLQRRLTKKPVSR